MFSPLVAENVLRKERKCGFKKLFQLKITRAHELIIKKMYTGTIYPPIFHKNKSI